MRLTRKRFGALTAVTGLLGSSLAVFLATAPIASADTTQVNACLGVTGTFSDFPIPLTGSVTATPGVANPGSATLGVDTINLTGVSIAVAVDSVLIGAGVATGLVSASDSLANLGVTLADGSASDNAGINQVTSAPGSNKLRITGANTVEGTQQVQNTAPIPPVTFYVTSDSGGGSVVVYSSVTNPPALNDGLSVPDPGRTGTVLVGALGFNIPMNNTTWTPTGGTPVTFKEANVVPSATTAAGLTPADKTGAPLIILAKINGLINVPFTCWTGTSAVDGLSFTPSGAAGISTIASIPVVAPAAAPTCASPQAASVGGGQTVTVTPNCTDVNGNFTPSATSINVTTAPLHGTATVQANGSILYDNDGLGDNSDTFQYTATDAGGLTSSPPVVVNIGVLNNACDAGPDIPPGTGGSCSLAQVLILPVLPSTLSMEENQTGANPSDQTVILGGIVNASNQCVAGPITLNGQPQYACGQLNSVTVVNARGTDTDWNLTGQVSDFIDGTRGPLDTCTAVRNIDQTPKNNHCIPGGNLGWIPFSQIIHPSVPGDTAAIAAGAIILPPTPVAQTPPAPPAFPFSAPRQNTNSVTAPPGGLRTSAQSLCSAPVNQSGGTFQCDAGLTLAVPASAAAGTYTALLTLTLG